jgi:hypothetical protein
MRSKKSSLPEAPSEASDPVVRYYQSVPRPEGKTPEEMARLAYAGGDLAYEKYVKEYYENNAPPFRRLGDPPQERGRSTHGFARGIPGIRQWPLPPADY